MRPWVLGMFGIAWVLIILHLKVAAPHTPITLTADLERMVSAQEQEATAFMNRYRVYLQDAMPERLKWQKSYYNHAAAVLEKAKRYSLLLRDYQQKVRRSKAQGPSDIMLQNDAGDQLCLQLDLYLDELLKEIPRSQFSQYKDELPLQYNNPEGCRKLICYKGEWKWLYGDEDRQSTLQLLLSLESDVWLSALAVMQFIQLDGMPGWNWSCKFNTPIAIPLNAYPLPGEQATATIFIGSWNRQQVIYSSKAPATIRTERGLGIWKGNAGSTGLHTISGDATFEVKDHQVTLPWSFQYRVVHKHALLQLAKAQALYFGIPNPVSLTLPADVVNERPELIVAGAVVEPTGQNHYSITITDPNRQSCRGLIIAHAAHQPADTLGALVMKVVPLPPPVLAIKETVSMAELMVIDTLSVIAQDADQDFHWTITGYKLQLITAGADEYPVIELAGNGFSRQMKVQELLKSAKSKSRLILSDLQVIGPRGKAIILPAKIMRISAAD